MFVYATEGTLALLIETHLVQELVMASACLLFPQHHVAHTGRLSPTTQSI